MKGKAKEQLNHGEYNNKSHEEVQAQVKAAKRELGALVTTEAPYLLTQVNKAEDRMKYKKVKNAIRKRKRDLKERICEGQALVMDKAKELGSFGQLYPTHARRDQCKTRRYGSFHNCKYSWFFSTPT